MTPDEYLKIQNQIEDIRIGRDSSGTGSTSKYLFTSHSFSNKINNNGIPSSPTSISSSLSGSDSNMSSTDVMNILKLIQSDICSIKDNVRELSSRVSNLEIKVSSLAGEREFNVDEQP